MLVYLAMIETEEDRSLFEQVYLKYKGLMYHVAYGILHHREDAEDAVHAAFESMAKNIEKISGVDRPETHAYAVVIVERKAIDILRKNSRTVNTDFSEWEPGIEIPLPIDSAVSDALAQLKPRYRELVLMHYAYGYKTDELAEMFDMKADTVRKTIWRGKTILREALRKEGVME